MTVVLASAFGGFVANFIGNGFLPLAPFIIPRGLVGCCLSLQSFSNFATLLFVGPIVDHVGSRLVLQCGLVFECVSIALTTGSEAVEFQMLGRVTQGIASSVIFNSSISFVMDHFEEPERAKHIGTVLGAFMTGGFVGTPVMSTLYALADGMPFRLAWAFLPVAILLPIALVLVSCTPSHRSGQQLLQVDSERSCSTSRGVRLFGVYRTVGIQALLLATMIVCSCFACGALNCAGLLEMHASGLSSGKIGLAFVPSLVAQAIASPWAGRVCQSPARRKQCVLSSMVVLACGLSMIASLSLDCHVVRVVVASTVLCSTAMALIDAPSISLMTDLATPCGCGNGEAVTASELAVSMGFALGPFVGQLLLRCSGFSGLCYFIVAVATCSGVLSSIALEEGGESTYRHLDANAEVYSPRHRVLRGSAWRPD